MLCFLRDFRLIRESAILLTGLFSLSLSSQSYAVIGGGAAVGKEWVDTETQGDKTPIAGNQLQAYVMVDPIPLVPVGAGLNIRRTQFDKLPEGFNGAEITTLSLELIGWLPMVPVITPYAKIGYNVYGQFKQKVTIPTLGEATFVDKVSGTRIALGIEWPFLKVVGLTLEAAMHNEKAKPDSITLPAGVTADDFESADYTLTGKSLLIGAKVSI